MDVLTDILSSLRLTGGVIVDAEFTGDFAVQAEFTPEKCAPFFPMPETMIGYHYVRSGQAIVEVDGHSPVTVGAGELVILPRNDRHVLASSAGLPPADVEAITVVTSDGLHHLGCGTGGAKTEVWCGFLGTAKDSAHPLLDALPPLLTLDVKAGQEAWLDASMRFLAKERATPDMVARVAELLVGQAIREYVDQIPASSKGWLRGLADPAVSKALSIIHTRYAEELDVEGLAKEAGVSRSVLGERFVELIGEPPMRYCARWRMRVASNMLRDGKQNTANIAYAVGFNSEAAFNRAFKREYGEPPATWRRRIDAKEQHPGGLEQVRDGGDDGSAAPDDTIRYCSASDGASIAYATSGEGFPLVKTPNWMTHLQHDWTSPVYGHWLRECARTHRVVRADMRGFGMSDWDPPEFDFEALVADLAAVIDAAEVEQCDLLGISHGGAIAMAYAARHPERVRKLVLVNSFAAGWRVRADPEEVAWRESLLEMNRRQPSFRRSLLGEMFITLYFPSAKQPLIDWHNEQFETLGPVPNMQRMIELAAWIDVRGELASIKAPTLVCHASLDGNAPVSVGQEVAKGIAGSHFVELDSANHVLLGDEPAWDAFVKEMRAFLSG
jgi:pimeloyl-ACP methyl ester carboxylesterase/AraC-like DNA-binding protein